VLSVGGDLWLGRGACGTDLGTIFLAGFVLIEQGRRTGAAVCRTGRWTKIWYSPVRPATTSPESGIGVLKEADLLLAHTFFFFVGAAPLGGGLWAVAGRFPGKAQASVVGCEPAWRRQGRGPGGSAACMGGANLVGLIGQAGAPETGCRWFFHERGEDLENGVFTAFCRRPRGRSRRENQNKRSKPSGAFLGWRLAYLR